jgi:pyruvate/2-oxoglutarate dehydrogenase complex dihydrolipoamide acyltransferase (E2) component
MLEHMLLIRAFEERIAALRQSGALQGSAHRYLNLSFDHRAVDGAPPAARYLNAVKRLLELPASLIV